MKPLPVPTSTITSLRQLAGFSRREVRGFVGLLLALTSLVLLPMAVRWWAAPTAAPALAVEEVRALDQLAGSLERAEQQQRRARFGTRRPAWGGDAANQSRRTAGEYNGHRTYGAPTKVAVLKHLTPFDPNTLDAMGWQQRGVPADVARRIVSYGRKAGGYRYREQLERIHGLEPRLFARLAPLLLLPSREEAFRRPAPTQPAPAASSPLTAALPVAGASTSSRPTTFRKPRVAQAFDLNTADTLTLMQLRGIGRKRAARIVALREQLGGFTTPAQLADVWGLDAEVLDTLQRYARVEPSFQPRQLAINSASVEELRAHPYVGYRLARVLVAYREQHGPFAQAADLLDIKVLDQATYQKLLPYVALR